jgi:hypothetical protein
VLLSENNQMPKNMQRLASGKEVVSKLLKKVAKQERVFNQVLDSIGTKVFIQPSHKPAPKPAL